LRSILADRFDEAAAYYGHFHEARIMTEQAAVQGRSPWVDEVGNIVPALREVEVGNIIPARREATDAVRKGLDRDGQLAMALVFARAGNIEQAGKLADTVSQMLHWILLSRIIACPRSWLLRNLISTTPRQPSKSYAPP